MKIGEKLFLGSIVSLLLGVLLASPLLYTNIVIGHSPEPLLGVEVTYVYIEKITGTYVPYGGFLPDSQNPNATTLGIPRVNYFVTCNLTRLSDDIDPCDAKFMIYQIKFYSDNGFVGNLGMYEGIIYNSDFVLLPRSENETDGLDYNTSLLWDIFKDQEFFGDFQPIAAGGSHGTWDLGESRTQCMSGVSDRWGSNFGDTDTVSVQVCMLGWIALRGNSSDAVILEEPEVVAEVQMEKFGDGFLYNKLIPEDELSQIDPLNPLGRLFGLEEDLN